MVALATSFVLGALHLADEFLACTGALLLALSCQSPFTRTMERSLTSTRLSVVIVSWNSGDLLRRCVSSVRQNPPAEPWELIVVDNASTDLDTQQYLAEVAEGTSSSVRIIQNQANLGFARAANQGLRLSNGDLALLLNPDTEVTAGALQVLINTVNADAMVGACGPRLVTADGSPQPSVWREASIPYTLVDGLPLHKLLPPRLRGRLLLGRHWAHDRPRSVTAFSAAAMMVRMAMVRDIGLLNEAFEMYGEDAEWCHRMTRRGWILQFEPRAEIIHHGGRSALQRWSDDDRRLRETTANVRFQLLCYSPARAAGNLAAAVFVTAVMGVAQQVRGKPTELTGRVLSVQFDGLRNALRKLLKRGGRSA